MLGLFLTVFYVLFAVLSGAYVFLQRRRQPRSARFLWVPLYLFLLWELTEGMFWSNQQLFKRKIYLQVGHASILLVEIWLSWMFLVVIIIFLTFFAKRKPASDNR
ncbi:hypothetical protein [Hymenobacter wooponensis]|uniref:Lycopene cyclase domain-containing protein n=1 Tax=Hymenobacter wooponensis TaxID=1525360 RepID=A0A4Z0MBS3_9BACT|nr:hypothetical protein [Hymenobacter wooponensis]TGD76798.1 hypothetical protein EU557_25160 [Hymenobacter wooponensis]